ncbi:MAG TPA: thrombospondin type 3 repeat-containing protein [Kofleriaceae bacterium]
MIRIVVLLGLVACYSPSYKDCEVTCSSGTCPAGYRCEQGMCRAPGFSGACGQMNGDTLDDTMMADAMIDGNPNLDSDGDGVMDNVDNCILKANANQANEDGDARGDVCDPCPPFTQYLDPLTQQMRPADVDSDGDSVGDGCDVFYVSSPGDRIVFFEGFKDNTVPANVMVSGPWSFTNGQARVLAQQATPASLRFMNVTTDPARHEILSSVATIHTFTGGGGMIRALGLVTSYDGSRGAGCLWGQDTSSVPHLMLVDVQGTGDIAVTREPLTNPLALPATTWMLLRRQVNQPSYQCYVSNEPLYPFMSFGPVPQGNIGLRARSADASFDWIMLVDRASN